MASKAQGMYSAKVGRQVKVVVAFRVYRRLGCPGRRHAKVMSSLEEVG